MVPSLNGFSHHGMNTLVRLSEASRFIGPESCRSDAIAESADFYGLHHVPMGSR